MTDGHIHIERGPYTLDWIQRFADRAAEMRIDEIWLLEHSFRFGEFVPMYGSVCAYSEYVDAWFHRQAGVHRLNEYLDLIERARGARFPVRIRFGLEICYFKEFEDLTAELTGGKGFDFLLGSVHFVDDFAFDHRAEHWAGMDVDRIYRRYFEDSVSLAKSGIFDGIGHPDTIKLFGHRPSYPLAETYESLAEELSKGGMYADQNSGAERRCPGTVPLGMDAELIRAKKKLAVVHEDGAEHSVDIGHVGEVENVNAGILEDNLDRGYIPVVAPIGVDESGAQYNINADYVAAAIAGALKAEKLLLLTDVEGIYKNFSDKSSFISSLTKSEAEAYIEDGTISGGMIPKVEACLTALSQGAQKTSIIDGRLPHSLLLELFTSQGIGTEIVKG